MVPRVGGVEAPKNTTVSEVSLPLRYEKPGASLFLTVTPGWLASIASGGLLLPWLLGRLDRQVVTGTVIGSDALVHRPSIAGAAALAIWGAFWAIVIVALPILVALVGDYMQAPPKQVAQIAFWSGAVMLIPAWHFLTYTCLCWRLRAISWRGVPCTIESRAFSFTLRASLWTVSQFATLGLSTPWADLRRRALLIEGAQFGSHQFKLGASPLALVSVFAPVFITSCFAAIGVAYLEMNGGNARFSDIAMGLLALGVILGAPAWVVYRSALTQIIWREVRIGDARVEGAPSVRQLSWWRLGAFLSGLASVYFAFFISVFAMAVTEPVWKSAEPMFQMVGYGAAIQGSLAVMVLALSFLVFRAAFQTYLTRAVLTALTDRKARFVGASALLSSCSAQATGLEVKS